MKQYITLFLLVFFAPLAVHSATPKQGFEDLKRAIILKDYTLSRQYITASSYPLFDKFKGYDLMGCLPTNASYTYDKKEGDQALVRAEIENTDASQKAFMHLVFNRENNLWKLDLPKTLRRGLGESWEQHVHNYEQIYLLLKAQMGDKLNCEAIRQIVEQPS